RWSRAAKRRVWAVVLLVVIGAPAFVIGGKYWVGDMDLAEAVARFRMAGPAAAQPVPGLPEPGVYRYRTSGGEHISFLDYHRNYSDTTMRIVTRHACGVREEQWFLVQHVEYYDRCGEALVSYGTDIAYWWTHGTQDFGCSAGNTFDMGGPGRRPGDRVEWTCADEDTRADQVTEYLGDVDVVFDGQPIRARHARWVTTFSGATVGVATVEDWFHPANGLVLREKRTIGLRVGSPFVGRLDYIDQSEFTLLSLTPAR
ncbi:MAG: hypothetical protein ACRD2W_02010, partial [Acidimicrobiales bacterium]